MPDYSFYWNDYSHPNLVLAFSGVLTANGMMKDMSRNGLDGTIIGMIRVRRPYMRAKRNHIIYMLGSSRVIVNNDPRLFITRPTMIAWYYRWITSESGQRGIICKGNTTVLPNMSYAMYLDLGSRTVNVSIGNGTDYNLCTSKVKVSGDYFVVGMVGDEFIELYINGRLVGKEPRTIEPFNDGQVLTVGSMTTTSSGFMGYMDEVRLYNNVAFTPAQIWRMYRLGVPRL